jgi:hypothetical protein
VPAFFVKAPSFEYNNLATNKYEVTEFMQNLFNQALIAKTRAAQTAEIIQPVQIGNTFLQNELVFFIKPELLDIEDDAKVLNSLKMIGDLFAKYQVQVNGLVILPGKVLADYETMNRHYGFINQLSRQASTMVNDEIRQEMFQSLNVEDHGDHKILGGHEFLETYSSDVETLNKLWFGQGAQKLRSGFYFVAINYNGDPILLINGFNPSQLLHFTREDHRIILMLIHSDTDWYDLKFNLVGDTFPAQANLDSIRGQLFAHSDRFGLDDVGINSNGVHLSAGPFEAAFEIINFFGDILPYNPHTDPPLVTKQAINSGIDPAIAMSLLNNPEIGESDLFSETENLNTDAAIKVAREKFINP